MNLAEYKIWCQESKELPGQWIIDQIHKTTDDLLVYKEVEAGIGVYIMINRGIIQLGAYKGAIPHIGEAEFKTDGTWNLKGHAKLKHYIKNLLLGCCGLDLAYQVIVGDTTISPAEVDHMFKRT